MTRCFCILNFPFHNHAPENYHYPFCLLIQGIENEHVHSCCVTLDDNGLACGFFIGQAQVAYSRNVSDTPAIVEAWLVTQIAIAMLRRWPIELEPHAEVLEVSPSYWHWLHVRDRIADPDDILAPLAEVLTQLAASPIATTFYSYSSLNHFCFSASSHYPWVNHGLPAIVPAAGRYLVGDKVYDRDEGLVLDGHLGACTVCQLVHSMLDMPLRARDRVAIPGRSASIEHA